MQCYEARQAMLDTQYDPQSTQGLLEELESHLRSCEACQQLAQTDQVLNTILDLDPTIEPAPGFDTRLFARINQVQKQREKFNLFRFINHLRWPLMSGALAATAIAALVLNFQPTGDKEFLVDPDLALAMEIELLENIDLVAQLDAVEDFDILNKLDLAELANPLSNTKDFKETQIQ